jgi:GTP pyrophosphokinase
MSADPSLIRIAVLHDLLVHPDGEELLERSPLTESERALVRQLHPLRRLNIDDSTEDLNIVIHAFAEDARLLLIRMAHRLCDIRNLKRFPHKLKHQIASEALHMYTAIAGRLGMHAWRYEMEDTCFRLLQAKIVRQLEEKFRACAALDRACLAQAQRFLKRKLREANLEASVDGRIKQMYSTYRKMVIRRRRFEELTDRLALRIVVTSITDCYHALGIVHACFHPMPGKLKDYIGAPKENGYRSIHTVIYPLPGVTEQPIEIQIRTTDMNEECEYGIAKHGEYKNAIYALQSQSTRVNLFRNLQSLQEEARSPKQFAKALRTYFNENHIVVFDAKNNLYHLRKPVTALDAACHAFGKRCKFLKNIRVNGRVQHLDTTLRDGDTIEPIFGRDRTVKRDWLHACRHARSRTLIRQLLKS